MHGIGVGLITASELAGILVVHSLAQAKAFEKIEALGLKHDSSLFLILYASFLNDFQRIASVTPPARSVFRSVVRLLIEREIKG